MSTKEKILDKALSLFNEKGVDQVSVLQISQALGISYGNLTYHFKHKEAIIMTLYNQLQEALNEAVGDLVKSIFDDVFQLDFLRKTFEVTWNYRFVYLNINSLMFQYEGIRIAEQQYAQSRALIMGQAKEHLIREDLIKPAGHVNYQLTIRNLSLILYSWIMDAKLFYTGTPDKMIDEYVALFYNVALPNLTEKGIKKFQELFEA